MVLSCLHSRSSCDCRGCRKFRSAVCYVTHLPSRTSILPAYAVHAQIPELLMPYGSHLPSRTCEIAARVVHAQDPRFPVAQFGQLKVGVALPEARAPPEHPLAGETGPHREHSRPPNELPVFPRLLQHVVVVFLGKRPAVSDVRPRYRYGHRNRTNLSSYCTKSSVPLRHQKGIMRFKSELRAVFTGSFNDGIGR